MSLCSAGLFKRPSIAIIPLSPPEFGVHVLAVALEMLADGDSLLDEAVKVLRDGRCEACKSNVLGSTHYAADCDSPFDLRIRRILLPVTDLT